MEIQKALKEIQENTTKEVKDLYKTILLSGSKTGNRNDKEITKGDNPGDRET